MVSKRFMALLIVSFLLVSCRNEDSKTSKDSDIYQKLVEMTQKKAYKKPQDFLAQGYCYFVFQGIIDPVEVTPRLFSLYVKGGSLSASHLESYEKWLKEENGQLCQKVIGPNFQPLSLEKSKKYAILLNEKAIERDGEKIDLIYQHELLHIAYAHFKEKKGKVKKLWAQLAPKQQLSFKQKHAGYNFKNEDVLWREYFAYTFQKRPEEGILWLVR